MDGGDGVDGGDGGVGVEGADGVGVGIVCEIGGAVRGALGAVSLNPGGSGTVTLSGLLAGPK